MAGAPMVSNSGHSGHHLESRTYISHIPDWCFYWNQQTSLSTCACSLRWNSCFQMKLNVLLQKRVRENTRFWGIEATAFLTPVHLTPHTFARFRVPSIDTTTSNHSAIPVLSINFPRRLINNFMFVSNVSLLNKSWGFWTPGFWKMVSH